jgi:methyl-accepting chemotaxis protein/methyl-accepting chemotaxis protein-1 (serine sensor receptor)
MTQAGTCLAIVGICAFAWWAMGDLAQNSNAMLKRAQTAEIAARLAENGQRLRASQHAQQMYTFAVNEQLEQKARQEFDNTLTQMQSDLAAIKPRVQSPDSIAALADATTALAKVPEIHVEIDRLFHEGKGMESLSYGASALPPVFDQMDAGFARLSKTELELLDGDRRASESVYAHCEWICCVLFVVAMATVGIAVYFIHEITSKLSRVSTDLAQGSKQVADAASQVREFSQALAQGASEQASSLEETSSSTIQINAITSQNATSAGRAAELVNETLQHVGAGNSSVTEMTSSMKEIAASSQQISKIIKLIDEIAFQTNILSLNAAVEAARAGEAGMGFAVVADEVRNLAQRCAQAARDTTGLIEVSHHRTEAGMKKLEQVESAIASITGVTDQLKALMDEVSSSSLEQKKGLDQIAHAVEQMEQLTQRNANSAQEGASNALEMGRQSENLLHVVSELESLLGVHA